MKNFKNLAFVMILLLLALISAGISIADEIGCCINPGAGALVCSLDRLALRDKECCPKPETNFTEYYKSTQNPNAPTNYNDCVSKFFFGNTDCSTINSCTIGCCCSEDEGTITSEVQCKGASQTFFKGETDCSIACPTPQCNDGIDNDNNGCADFDGGDLGCFSTTDTTEAGGSCSNQVPSCADSTYTPKLSSFSLTPAKGEKKFFLVWSDECKQNALSYEISRCKGSGCTNFAIISTSNTNSFTDSSDELLFDTTYTYQIKARYSPQAATPTITKSGSLGNAQCTGRKTNNLFCSSNAAFFCDSLNTLVSEGTKCPSQQICSVDGNKASCLSKSSCNNDAANPFAMYNTITGCEVSNYCFYDKSHTTVDSCFACDSAMSCYDYKSEQSCIRDNCNVAECKWKPSSDDIGIGVCISTSQSNCPWCDQKGTKSMQNSKSYNEVFDICTQEKSDALSDGNLKCYFSNQKSKSCSDVVCTDYEADQCSSAPITHDDSNNIINPSKDQCGIEVCQNINSGCSKNADGDNQADCTTSACERDYFPPNTLLSPSISSKNILQSLLIQINDKVSSNGSEIIRTDTDYFTYICVEPCGINGHPYITSTKGRSLVVSNLKIFDSSNGSLLMTLKEGFSVLRYYSIDPSRNIGEVKKLTVEAHSNTTGPKIFNITATDGNKVNEKIYTKNQKPTLTVQFYEPATITFARIVSKDRTRIVNLKSSTNLGVKIELPVSEILANGEYTFELNAKNKDSIFMDPPASVPIIIDNVKPKLNITPSDGAVLLKSDVAIRLQFDKEVSLESVSLNSEDIKDKLSTLDNRLFSVNMNLTDGLKELEVSASSLSLVTVSASSSFIVDAVPTRISIAKPKFGVSPSYIFDLEVETDNDAECRYALDKNFEFDFMDSFTTTGGTIHSIKSFDKIAQNDLSIHKLNIRCKDTRYGIAFKQFDLSVDTTPPEIRSAFAFPNPVIEKPAVTALTVETDEPAICKYSKTSSNFDSMESKFSGFENNTFKTINKQNITLQSAGDYRYYVSCRNKADLLSASSEIKFNVDFSLLMSIISHTPEYFGATKVTLAIETTKTAQCLYSETDQTARDGDLFSTPAGYNHQQQLNLSSGKHTFYIVCKDQFLQAFSDIATVNFTIDVTAPLMQFVDDTSTFELFPEKTCLNDRLRVKFLAEDQESKVSEYFYALFKKLDNKQLLSFIKTFESNEWIWVENLNLSDNSQYYFGVKSNNVVGLQSLVKNSDGITVDKTICQAKPVCGDGLINLQGEECDKDTFGAVFRCTQYTNFIGGTLKCTNDCNLDPSGCIKPEACGNGKIDPGETCDGSKFGAIDSCTDYSASFSSGTLKCTSTCQLDTGSCTEKTNKCGNTVIDIGETCDGSNFGPLTGTCIDYKASQFTGGNLKCTSCKVDTSQCQGTIGTCGDGLVNIGEACDGTVFGGIDSCTDYVDFAGGTLKCTSACQLDTGSCTSKQKCGNSFIDKGESCDTNTLGLSSSKCVDYSQDFESGSIICKEDCKLDTSGCTKTSEICGNNKLDTGEICDGSNFGAISDLSCKSYSSLFMNGTIKCIGCSISTNDCIPKPVPKCGDGIVNLPGEQCDASTFGIINKCTQYTNFVGGILRCDDDCLLDTSDCIQRPTCGNSQLDPDEACDGNAFGAIDGCNDYSSFSGGTLKCTQKCELDTTGCTEKAKCGNTVIDKGESCDGTNLGPLNGKCADYKPNLFTGGDIACGSCQLDTSKCKGTVGTCGDSILNIGESCDGSTFGLIDSCTDYVDFAGGTLKCTSGCKLDTSGCTEKAKCGNGIVDKSESCDTNNLGIVGNKCIDYSLSFSSGTISCTSECILDTSNCVKAPTCGNSKIDSGELCDGTKFLNITDLKCSTYSSSFISGNLKCTGCQISTVDCELNTPPECGDGKINQAGEECDSATLGFINKCTQYTNFIGGTLKCNNDCKLDTSGCSKVPTCGNNELNPGESCDASIFGQIKSCTDYSASFSSGTLKCTSTCQLDTGSCTEKTNKCGNTVIDIGETCDGSNFGPLTGTCIDYKASQFTGGNLKCTSCKVDTSQCQGTIGTCGDGLVNIGEACDGTVFGGIDSCTDYVDFAGGTLKCTSACQLDTGSCTSKQKCGNSFIDKGESCDGTNLGPLNGKCVDYSSVFNGGTIKCTGDCKLDTSECIKPEGCGDLNIDPGESCDGNSFGQIKSCTDYSSSFNGGTLKCTSTCQLDTSSCQSKLCGNGFIDQGETCDGTNLGPINGKCVDYSASYISGTITCDSSCKLDTSKCQTKVGGIPTCGDEAKNQLSEDCDGSDLAGKTCQTLGYSSGTLKCSSGCALDTSSCSNPLPKYCGNSAAEKPNSANFNEDCDKTDLAGKSCTSFTAYSSGTLSCKSDCTYNFASCTPKPDVPKCGDGAKNQLSEDCDSLDLAGKTCPAFGYNSGSLSCKSDCSFDTSSCNPAAGDKYCGDTSIQKPNTAGFNEDCDKTNLGGKSCSDIQAYESGSIACKSDCTYNFAGCKLKPPEPKCGDDSRNKLNEDCDGSDLAGKTCQTLGYSSGALKCSSGCALDTSSCSNPLPKYCGNSAAEKPNSANFNEDCDKTDLAGKSCTSFTAYSSGTLSCKSDCTYNVASCILKEQPPVCGNGKIESGEVCDGSLFGQIDSCTDYGASFTGGTLKCTSTCQLDTSSCVEKPKCGNSAIDIGESCDGANLGPLNGKCADYSSTFNGGTLKCSSDCKLDTSPCTRTLPSCGNGALNTGEICDGTNFGNLTDLRCSMYSNNFIGGSINCTSCQISTSNCRTEDIVPGIRCKDRGDCGVGETCTDNSDCASRYCSNGKCTQATCSDNVKNQGESSVDCGGPCGKCGNGNSCNTNAECLSDFCYFGTCKAPEICLDGKLSPGEADTDCGGICPTKCASGKNCDSDADCGDSLKCKSSECIGCMAGDDNCDGIQDSEQDSDGDGLPDTWEIENGLNPDDPNDATEDTDNDGLTNYEEYDVQRTYQDSTDPNAEDTDNDGYSDKEELDKGTNPLDAEDFPRSSFGKTILIIIGILVLVAGFGYLTYSSLSKKKKQAFEFERQRTMPRIIPSQQPRQIPIRPRVTDTRVIELLKKKQEEKQKEREGLIKSFAKEGAEKPKVESKEKKGAKPAKEHKKTIRKAKRKPTPKKPKEDAFIKLKELANEAKKKGSNKQK